jgi:hypothetical protein
MEYHIDDLSIHGWLNDVSVIGDVFEEFLKSRSFDFLTSDVL